MFENKWQKIKDFKKQVKIKGVRQDFPHSFLHLTLVGTLLFLSFQKLFSLLRFDACRMKIPNEIQIK